MFTSKITRKPYCNKCDGGWIPVPDYLARKLYKDPNAMAYARCECRREPKLITQPSLLPKKTE